MRLLFLTGSRGEWGYIRPILRLCQQEDVDYRICATNMHLLPGYGRSVDLIKRDGFEVEDEIFMALDGYNHVTMAKSMAVLQMSLVDVVSRCKPDWLVLAGDRAETLIGAVVGAYTYTPTAHIQAGERSGNIDGQARHAIGKLVHLHLAANQDAADRLLRLGEQPHRVHVVGAPQLDELVQSEVASAQDISDKLSFDCEQNYLLVVQHPVTEQFLQTKHHMEALLAALSEVHMPKVFILPNNDAGTDQIRESVLGHRQSGSIVARNLERAFYLGLLKHCSCIVGNSSSGLLEAPTFGIPAVNIGRRQANRVRGRNVIDVEEFETGRIVRAITRACSAEFRSELTGMVNPYGDGHSAARILSLLRSIPRDSELLVKQLTY